MGMLLLWCAASIIVPIIRAEGITAVFFPYLVRQPQVRAPQLCTHMPLCIMTWEHTQLIRPGVGFPHVCPTHDAVRALYVSELPSLGPLGGVCTGSCSRA